MRAPKETLLAATALVCLAAVPNAQGLRRVTKPLRPVTLDLQTGTITPGPPVPNPATCVSIFNGDRSGFVGVDTGKGAPNGPCEWIDTARKSGRCAGIPGNDVRYQTGGFHNSEPHIQPPANGWSCQYGFANRPN